MNTEPSREEIVLYDDAIQELLEREQKTKQARKRGLEYNDLYNKALIDSHHQNKHIFILFYLDGCSGCYVIKHLMKYNESIKNYLDNYIVLQFDMSVAHSNLTQKYNIYNYPCYMILDHEENIIKKGFGCIVEYGPENYFLNWLKAT